MNSTFSLLLVFLARLFMPRHNAQMRLLKAQIHILRARIPAQRIILTPAEKSELLRIGAEFGHDIDGLIGEIGTALQWRPHTARGALAGALKKKLGLTITSEKVAERGRIYRIED